MKYKVGILIFLVVIATSCKTKHERNTSHTSVKEVKSNSLTIRKDTLRTRIDKIDTAFNLKYGFSVKAGGKDYDTYSYFELRNQTKIVFSETAGAYEFQDKLYPIILKTGKNKYELLFELDNRPNKDLLQRFTVKDSKVIKIDTLPTFISQASNLNHTGIMEYAGFWDYGEVWGDSAQYTVYNPILYYKITLTGLKLDSSLTIDKNNAIYGKFHGFEYNGDITMPSSVGNKFGKEIKRIEKMK